MTQGSQGKLINKAHMRQHTTPQRLCNAGNVVLQLVSQNLCIQLNSVVVPLVLLSCGNIMPEVDRTLSTTCATRKVRKRVVTFGVDLNA